MDPMGKPAEGARRLNNSKRMKGGYQERMDHARLKGNKYSHRRDREKILRTRPKPIRCSGNASWRLTVTYCYHPAKDDEVQQGSVH